jgi:hypothetical protein
MLRTASNELRMRGTARLPSLRGHEPFFFAAERHRYFFHHYNTTWLNERTIEIPLAAGVL